MTDWTKKKAWEECLERGLIEDGDSYEDYTKKELITIIEMDGEENTEDVVLCVKCDEKEGVDRGDGIFLCNECYATSIGSEPKEDVPVSEKEVIVIDDEEEDVPEEPPVEEPSVEPPVEVPKKPPATVPVAVVSTPKPKISAMKVSRNAVVKGIPVGTVVSFRCKPGSNIRNFAGDQSVGFVLTKRDKIREYVGPLTKRMKKDIEIGKIILLR